MATLLPAQLIQTLPASQAAIPTSKEFFPQLISAPFGQGLAVVFIAAALMSVVAAWA